MGILQYRKDDMPMIKKSKVELLINDVMTDLEMRGYKSATLEVCRSICRRVQKYFAVIGEDEYTEAHGQSFIEFVIT